MKRLLSLIAISLTLFGLSGCKTKDTLQEVTGTVTEELTDAAKNVGTKITDTKDWVQNKTGQAEQAAEDVQEAADSFNQAINSLKQFSNFKSDEATPDAGQATDQANAE